MSTWAALNWTWNWAGRPTRDSRPSGRRGSGGSCGDFDTRGRLPWFSLGTANHALTNFDVYNGELNKLGGIFYRAL